MSMPADDHGRAAGSMTTASAQAALGAATSPRNTETGEKSARMAKQDEKSLTVEVSGQGGISLSGSPITAGSP